MTQQQFAPNIDAFLTPETQALATIAAPIVDSMLGRQWLPVVLAIIDNESGGVIGQKAHQNTGISKTFPIKSGGVVTINKAFGLMQVIPINIEAFANAYKTTIYFEDFAGTSIEAAKIQIKMGVWVLKNMVRYMKPYVDALGKQPLTKDAISFVLMAYAIGQKPVKDLVSEMKSKGLPLTLELAEKTNPDMGKPLNKPFFYAKKILKKIAGIADLIIKIPGSSDLMLVIAAGLTIYLLLNK
jgi:hypothetical protein